MDTDLVIRAQRGDKGAFADLASGVADRYLAVARRILRDLNLAEDATQQALLSIWQDLPQLRDPARFEAWSYRLLVRACYAEGRNQSVTGRPTFVFFRLTSRRRRRALARSSIATSSKRGFKRLSIEHRAVVVLHHYLDMTVDEVAQTMGVPPSGRSDLDFTLQCVRCDRPSRPMRDQQRGRWPDEFRS